MNHKRADYFRFTTKARLDKAINSLVGVVEGIDIDTIVNPAEIEFLSAWLDAHREFSHRHPFNELVPLVGEAVADGKFTDEEKRDILWLCRRLSDNGTHFYDRITADIQQLHGVLGGIAADGTITSEELRGLSDWLEEHAHLRTCWPYDEIGSLTTSVLADQRIDPDEQELLLDFFAEFGQLGEPNTIIRTAQTEPPQLRGLCAIDPEITFRDSLFCFTGASRKHSRDDLMRFVVERGGRVTKSVSKMLNYLVIGSDGNPCWSYSCYGRKVEEAMALRKQGSRILLVHEFDFADAVADCQLKQP